MVLESPLWNQNLAYPARLDRQLFAVLFTEGVINVAADMKVSQRAAGANMSVDVAAGQCVIAGDDQADQGSYLCRSTVSENRTIAAADASQIRYDRIVARVRDSNVTGVVDEFAIEVLTGTPGGANPPATPNTALALARVRVPAGAASITNADITDERVQSDRQQIRIGTQADPLTQADRDANAAPEAGMLVYNLTSGALEVGDGAAWDQLALAENEVKSLGSAKLAGDAPSTYPRGVSYHHGTEANGWPALGPVLTTYPLNEIWITQVQIPASGGTPLRRMGRNDSDVWFSWRQDARASNGSYTGDGTASRSFFVSEEPPVKQVQITRRGAPAAGAVLTAWCNRGSDRGYAMHDGGSVAGYTGFVMTASGFTVPSQINLSGVVYDYTAIG